MKPVRLLLIEDDERLGALYAELLRSERFGVVLAGTLAEAEAFLEGGGIDLVILDLGLPDGDGLEWLETLRRRYDGPVLVATARGEPDAEIVGLARGADDYLAKPIRADRLVARIRALLRRALPKDVLKIGALRIDASNRTVDMEGTSIMMTTAEFDLLLFLARRAGTVVERETLYQALRGIPWDGVDRSMDLRVSRLRKLIGDDPRVPRLLKTVRGIGYLLVAA